MSCEAGRRARMKKALVIVSLVMLIVLGFVTIVYAQPPVPTPRGGWAEEGVPNLKWTPVVQPTPRVAQPTPMAQPETPNEVFPKAVPKTVPTMPELPPWADKYVADGVSSGPFAQWYDDPRGFWIGWVYPPFICSGTTGFIVLSSTVQVPVNYWAYDYSTGTCWWRQYPIYRIFCGWRRIVYAEVWNTQATFPPGWTWVGCYFLPFLALNERPLP